MQLVGRVVHNIKITTMSLIEAGLKIIAPHDCLNCGQEGNLLCQTCLDSLPPIAPRCYRCLRPADEFMTCPACRQASRLHQVWAVTTYNGPAKSLIHQLKFERARAGALDIARKLALIVPSQPEWIVSHLPTATSRVRRRGYDQAQLIAKELARLLGLAYTPLLARYGQERQLGQSRRQRQRQLEAAFRPRNINYVNKTLLLIDDVLTTGATIEAAATVLKVAGALRVSAAVFAVA